MVLPVLYVTEATAAQAVAVLKRCGDLGQRYKGLMLASVKQHDDVVTAANLAFTDIRTFVLPEAKEAWPGPMNRAWQEVARWLDANGQGEFPTHNAWLWWEPHAIPLRSDWLQELDAEHKKKRSLFVGPLIESPSKHMHRVGIWPMQSIEPLCDCSAFYARTAPFDIAAGSSVMCSFSKTDRIAVHPKLYNKTGIGSCGYAGRNEIDKIAQRNPNVVLYHGVSLLEDAGITTSTHHATVAPIYTISVLCLNNSDLTKQCLDSILEHSNDYELYVTNNASTDDTAAMLADYAAKHPRLTVITNAKNEGFQTPNERVLNLARGRYFVLFNNDMVACDGWLEGLREPFDNSPNMALTGIAGVCSRISEDFKGEPGDDAKPEYIEGGCLMGSAALLRKHGLFSPYLKFIYWEDTDLGLRMRELGYEIATVRLPITHHHRSATTRHLDLAEVRRHNHDAMWERWRFYIKRRNFERRVIVRRRGARGDVLLVTPALAALHAKWPKAILSVETAHPEMLAGLPYVHIAGTTFVRDEADHVFDLDFAYERKPGTPIVEVFAERCGVLLESQRPHMVDSASDRAWAKTVARGLMVALIHPGPTTWPGKNWPEDRWRAVEVYLRKQGFFTIAVGAKDSPDCGCDDSVAGCATPQQLYALCCESKLFVGLDSMPQHVASAADTPSVILFGATEPKDIMRQAPHLLSVQASLNQAECVGAHGRRSKAVTEMPCDGACMRAIEVRDVTHAIERLELC